MTKLATAFFLALLMTAPALAKHRNAISRQAAAAQASVPYDQYSPMVDSQTVVDNGKVLGRDPDPAIRSTLMREGDPAKVSGS